MKRVRLFLILAVLGLFGCGGGSGSGGSGTGGTPAGSQGPALVSIAIEAPSAVAVGTSQALTAMGIYSDGSKKDVTRSVTWNSSAPGVASVDAAGTVTSRSAGTTAITASSGSISSAAATLTVTGATLVSIILDPVTPTLAAGTTQQFTATGTFRNAGVDSTQDVTAQVGWSSANPGIASVSAGKVTAAAQGSTTISATLNGVTGSTTVVVTSSHLVSLVVEPGHPTLPPGSTVKLAATGTFSDGSTQDLTPYVTWQSSAAPVATISNTAGGSGTLTTVGTGSATISATSGGVEGTTTVTVAYPSSVSVAPANRSIPLGTVLQLTATATYPDGSSQDITSSATWSSSAPSVATVANSGGSGNVTAVGTGATVITALIPAGSATIAGSTTVTVTPATLQTVEISPAAPSVAMGTTTELSATGVYSDGSRQDLTRSVTWSSASPAIASVSNAAGSNGKVTPVAIGSTSITAASGTVSATVPVNVTPLNILNLQGTWVGTYTIYDDPGDPSEIGTYVFEIDFSQSGNTVTASPTLRGRTDGTSQLIGSINGNRLTFSFTYLSPRNGALMTDTGGGILTDNVINGSFVENSPIGYNCSYTFTVTKQP